MLRQQASWGDNSLLSPHFYIGEAMRLFELFEAKPAKKTVKAPPPRNFYAKAVTRKSGSGSHAETKHNRKEKHKKPTDQDSE